MDALRRSTGISRLDRKMNECIRENTIAPDTILHEITRKQLIWCGHVERMDRTGLPNIMINWKPERRIKRSRPRRTWKDGIYRVSQEECARLRESVPYVKLYRYNPKHLCPKLIGYGDNGQRKVWSSSVSTYCTPSVTSYLSNAPARQLDIVMQ